MTNNIDKNIRAMGDTTEEYNPDEGAQAGEGGEEQQNEGEAANQQVTLLSFLLFMEFINDVI